MQKPLEPARTSGKSETSIIYSTIISDLKIAKKPVLLAGGGCKAYKEQFRKLTEVLRIPAYATWNALDIVTSDLPIYAGVVGTYGGPGRNFGIQTSDLLIAVGTRLSGRITGGQPSNFASLAKKYWIDVDAGLQHNGCGIEPIVCDAGEFMAELAGRLGGTELDFRIWLERCRAWAYEYDPVTWEMQRGDFHHYGFMRRLSGALPANAIIVYDTGGSAIMMGHCFKGKWGQTIFSSNGNSPMGFAFCGALGAWFADKTRPIICVIGDGGFNMNIQELQTMMNYGCNVKTFILNNHCYGNTKLWQKANNKAFVACGPDGYNPPNFEAVARAYNVPVVDRIDCFCKLEEKIEEIVKQPFAAVIDVVHHDFYDYYPRISRFDQPLHEQDPQLPREEIEANLH